MPYAGGARTPLIGEPKMYVSDLHELNVLVESYCSDDPRHVHLRSAQSEASPSLVSMRLSHDSGYCYCESVHVGNPP
jgi:hypothetical protein